MDDIQEWDPQWLTTRGNYLTVITPKLAAELLEFNINNRNPRPRKIIQFGRDMLAKRWDSGASDIKISSAPYELIDGQNRLMAAVESDVSFPTLVRTGLSRETKNKVDSGTARTNADVLRMINVSGPHTSIAAAVNLQIRYLERIEFFDGTHGGELTRMVLTHDEMLEYLAQHPMMLKYANVADALRKNVMPAIPTSSILAFLGWAAEIDEELAASFADRLQTGDYSKGDPLQALVGYAAIAARQLTGSRGARVRAAQENHLLALCKTWNWIRLGRSIDRLRIGRNDRLEVPE